VFFFFQSNIYYHLFQRKSNTIAIIETYDYNVARQIVSDAPRLIAQIVFGVH